MLYSATTPPAIGQRPRAKDSLRCAWCTCPNSEQPVPVLFSISSPDAFGFLFPGPFIVNWIFLLFFFLCVRVFCVFCRWCTYYTKDTHTTITWRLLFYVLFLVYYIDSCFDVLIGRQIYKIQKNPPMKKTNVFRWFFLSLSCSSKGKSPLELHSAMTSFRYYTRWNLALFLKKTKIMRDRRWCIVFNSSTGR